MTSLYYIAENESPETVVGRVVDGIFEHKELDGYTFFAHNLGRFDAIFLIKGIISMAKYKVRATFKENVGLTMTITHKESKRKMKLLDSIQFVKGSLREILI